MIAMFLEDEELAKLTGYKFKSKQIEWLRAAAIPFRVSATGHPVVTRGAIEGRKDEPVKPQRWVPSVVGVH